MKEMLYNKEYTIKSRKEILWWKNSELSKEEIIDEIANIIYYEKYNPIYIITPKEKINTKYKKKSTIIKEITKYLNNNKFEYITIKYKNWRIKLYKIKKH